MALALIAFDFDPVLRLGNLLVARQTIALAAVVLIAVSLAAALAHRLPRTLEERRGTGGPRARLPPSAQLRRDDLLLILLGVVPGSIFGARIGYVVIHFDYYAAHPAAWLDFSQGSLELGFGVLGGALAGVAMARAIGASVSHWLHVWAVPVLVGLGLGKLTMVLAGAGQGIPADLPWATAYLGPGPWGSVLPDVPSHPAQAYEGVLDLVVAVLIGGLLYFGRFRDQDGRAFLAAITLWALARVEVAFVWRDPEVLGPFRSAQLVALVIAAVSLALFLWWSWAPDRSTRANLVDAGATQEAPQPALSPALRPERQPPGTLVPDRSGWLTAVRPDVEAVLDSPRRGARETPRPVKRVGPPVATGGGPEAAVAPTALSAAVAPTAPPAADIPPPAAATADETAAGEPVEAGAADATAHAEVTENRTLTDGGAPREDPPSATASAGAQGASPAAAQPSRRAREPWDPAVRRRPVPSTPGRSGWLTAVPTIVEPPTRPAPSDAEPRTSESSSSSSS